MQVSVGTPTLTRTGVLHLRAAQRGTLKTPRGNPAHTTTISHTLLALSLHELVGRVGLLPGDDGAGGDVVRPGGAPADALGHAAVAGGVHRVARLPAESRGRRGGE